MGIRSLLMYFSFLSASFAGHPLTSENRVWSGKDGSEVEARLVGAYDHFAFLERNEGVVRVPLGALVEADLELIVKWAGAYEDARLNRPTYGDSEARMTTLLRDAARRPEGRSLRRVDWEEAIEPEFFMFYFSAGWCGPCRRFTPHLKEWYALYRGLGYDNFEVFLVSSDRSAGDMRRYMVESEMPWPGVALNSRSHRELQQFGARSIPQLVVVDRFGHILFHSTMGGDYRGPSTVLRDFAPVLRASKSE